MKAITKLKRWVHILNTPPLGSLTAFSKIKRSTAKMRVLLKTLTDVNK